MGGIGSGRRSKAKAACPRPGHSGSRVKLDGTYGTCGVPKLDRALERGGLPLSRGRSLPALLGTRGVHASVGFVRLLAARTLAASAPDRIKAPHTPGDPCEQDEHDRVEADAVIHSRTATRGSGTCSGSNGATDSHNSSRTRQTESATVHLLAGLCHPERFARQHPNPPPKGIETASKCVVVFPVMGWKD
jgi:hypothetical protein